MPYFSSNLYLLALVNSSCSINIELTLDSLDLLLPNSLLIPLPCIFWTNFLLYTVLPRLSESLPFSLSSPGSIYSLVDINRHGWEEPEIPGRSMRSADVPGRFLMWTQHNHRKVCTETHNRKKIREAWHSKGTNTWKGKREKAGQYA